MQNSWLFCYFMLKWISTLKEVLCFFSSFSYEIAKSFKKNIIFLLLKKEYK